MPWIYSVRWRHINQWPCRHPMKDHLLVVIYAIQSVSLFWRENFDFKFMISDHKWLNRKLIKTFFVISKFYAAKEMSGPGGPGEPGRITVEFVWLGRHSERANQKERSHLRWRLSGSNRFTGVWKIQYPFSIFNILKTIPFWFYTLEVNMTRSIFFLFPGHGNKWPKNSQIMTHKLWNTSTGVLQCYWYASYLCT